jgi:DNA invertase Pin-like site-specific DNA recombinase
LTSPLLDAFLRDYVLPRAAEIPPEVRAFCASLSPGTRLAGNPRVSTEAQVSGGSLPEQREAFAHFAAANGLTVVWVQEDAGVSGRDVTRRDGLLRLLAGVAEGLFDVVAVYDLSRLSRRTTDGAAVLELLERYGARLATQGRVLDPAAEGDWLQAGLGLVVAESEFRGIVRRAKFGQRRKRDAGGWVGGHPPYGYAVPKRRGAPPAVVPDEAALVRRALLELYPHLSDEETAERLNAEGVTLRGSPWTRHSVYALHYRYRRGTQPRGHDRLLTYAGLTLSPSGDVIPAAWEPILTREELARLESVRDRRRQDPRARGHVYLLSGRGISRCGFCDSPVNGSSSPTGSGVSRAYRCSRRRGPCRNGRNWNVEDTDRAVLDALATRAAGLRRAFEVVVEDAGARAGELRRELGEVRKKKRRLAEAVAEGFPLDELHAEAARLNERETGLLAALADRREGEALRREEVETLTAVLVSPALLRADPDFARRAVDTLAERLTFGPGDPVKILWFDGSTTALLVPRRYGNRYGSFTR